MLLAVSAACSDEGSGPRDPAAGAEGGAPSPGAPTNERADAGASSAALTYRADISPITSVAQALPGVFIPPFEDCRAALPGDEATRADGMVCTNVAISGCTEPGKVFARYASCEVVRRQRPYWPAPPAKTPAASDARLSDAAYLGESAWIKQQLEASGCSCCHDGRVIAASQWDIALGPLWLDSLSDTGLALFAGLADSSVLGAYAPQDNHGFDRTATGIPTTDTPRMQRFLRAELARRGLSETWARGLTPFGGPIYVNSIKQPGACGAGEGVEPEGRVRWNGANARYVYVLRPGGKNPGVPPNLDLPETTLWRLDVLASAQALASGVPFGTTPAGSFQTFPAGSPALPLERGQTYQLVVLQDVGLPLANCLFEFGTPVGTQAAPEAGPPPPSSTDAGAAPYADAGAAAAGDAGVCTLAGGDAKGFGAPCNDTQAHSDCPCAANYCSKSPFDAQGYCSITGCKENPAICPTGWTCFDISQFAPGQPAVCVKP